MTEFDKKLIEKAQLIPRWRYRSIDTLVEIADTDEAREILSNLRWELHDSVMETI